MAGDARITLRLPQATVERLDRIASERGCSRARAFELLVEGSGPAAPAPTPERAVQLLAESAEAGSVTARVALARLLSSVRQPDAVQRRRDELAARRRAREAS
jgi:predicted transcriptional regulator